MIADTLQHDLEVYAGVRFRPPVDGPVRRIRMDGDTAVWVDSWRRMLRGQTPDGALWAELSAPLGQPLERVVLTAVLVVDSTALTERNTLALLVVLGVVFPSWPAAERNAWLTQGLRALTTAPSVERDGLAVTLEYQPTPPAARLTIAPVVAPKEATHA
jgi:hypothetical protein